MTATGNGLHVLLIEDNPGDARLIREMFRDAEELTRRIDPDDEDAEPPTVDHETRLEDGLAAAAERPVDVILLDLNLPDSAGLETLATVDERIEETPIVVLTGVSDQLTGIEAIERGAQDYLVKDEVTSALLVRSIHHAIERSHQQRERARRREELASLNRLNRIGQEIAHAVITTDTREALEQAVCDRLAAADAYRFAWIGAVSRGGQQVIPRVAAGVEEGYLDEITITIDDSATAKGPTGQAVDSGEVHVVDDVFEDPDFEPWREAAETRGYRSTAAIPVAHEELLYGVLNVYAPEAGSFGEREREVLGRMGDVVGHAIAALERKAALVSDEALELEFQVDGFASPLVELTAGEEAEIRFDRLIRSEEALLIYGAVEGVGPDEFRATAEEFGLVEDVRVLSPGSEAYDVELRADREIPLFESIATHGGRVTSARMDDGELRIVVELPRRGNTGAVIESVEDVCEDASYVAQRTVEREDARVPDQATLEAKLTEKQREALETAVYAGYFDWPRQTTGEEVAERLGIAPATFTQHLRAAEDKIFDAMLAERGEGAEDEPTAR